MQVDGHDRFVYHRSMNIVDDSEIAVSRIAAAIGEPARARILYRLMDGRARTSTELAVVAEVSPLTASVHLSRLKDEHPLNVLIHPPYVCHAHSSGAGFFAWRHQSSNSVGRRERLDPGGIPRTNGGRSRRRIRQRMAVPWIRTRSCRSIVSLLDGRALGRRRIGSGASAR
jgi:hypothetical protein